MTTETTTTLASEPANEKVRAWNENLELWNKVCETDPKTTKPVAFGSRKFTSVQAYDRIKRATELWGPYGSTWGLREIRSQYIQEEKEGSKTILQLHMDCVFFYPGGAFPYSNSIKFRDKNGIIDDPEKKLFTDTLTKCLSLLGFCGDVFTGKYDDPKYVREMEQKFANRTEREAEPDRQASQGDKQALLVRISQMRTGKTEFLGNADFIQGVAQVLFGRPRIETIAELSRLETEVRNSAFDLFSAEAVREIGGNGQQQPAAPKPSEAPPEEDATTAARHRISRAYRTLMECDDTDVDIGPIIKPFGVMNLTGFTLKNQPLGVLKGIAEALEKMAANLGIQKVA